MSEKEESAKVQKRKAQKCEEMKALSSGRKRGKKGGVKEGSEIGS